MGMFSRKALVCLTCNATVKRVDMDAHALKHHLVRAGEQFTYNCPCGTAAGRWDSLPAALASRWRHMTDSHRSAGQPNGDYRMINEGFTLV